MSSSSLLRLLHRCQWHWWENLTVSCLTGVNNTNEALLARTNIIMVYFISVTNTNNAYLTGVVVTSRQHQQHCQYCSAHIQRTTVCIWCKINLTAKKKEIVDNFVTFYFVVFVPNPNLGKTGYVSSVFSTASTIPHSFHGGGGLPPSPETIYKPSPKVIFKTIMNFKIIQKMILKESKLYKKCQDLSHYDIETTGIFDLIWWKRHLTKPRPL